MALPKLNTSRHLATIPSTGKEVEYRPYLVKEEKILMMALETKDQSAIIRAVAQVIGECVTQDIDTDKLAMFDIEYLFLQLRSKSSGEIIDLKLPCEVDACKHINNFHVDITQIPIPVVKKIEPIQLTDEIAISVRWPNVKDLQGLTGEELSSVEGASKMFAKLIVNIFEEDEIHNAADEPVEDLQAFVDSLNSAQFTKLAEFLGDIPTLELSTGFECSKCKHETKIELKGLQSFFI